MRVVVPDGSAPCTPYVSPHTPLTSSSLPSLLALPLASTRAGQVVLDSAPCTSGPPLPTPVTASSLPSLTRCPPCAGRVVVDSALCATRSPFHHPSLPSLPHCPPSLPLASTRAGRVVMDSALCTSGPPLPTPLTASSLPSLTAARSHACRAGGGGQRTLRPSLTLSSLPPSPHSLTALPHCRSLSRVQGGWWWTTRCVPRTPTFTRPGPWPGCPGGMATTCSCSTTTRAAPDGWVACPAGSVPACQSVSQPVSPVSQSVRGGGERVGGLPSGLSACLGSACTTAPQQTLCAELGAQAPPGYSASSWDGFGTVSTVTELFEQLTAVAPHPTPHSPPTTNKKKLQVLGDSMLARCAAAARPAMLHRRAPPHPLHPAAPCPQASPPSPPPLTD